MQAIDKRKKATKSAPTLILFLVHVWLTLEPGGEKGQTTPMNSTAANPLQEQLRLEWTVQTNIRWLPGKMCFQCRYSEIPLSNDNVTNATPDWGINSLDLPWISGGGVARLENGVTNHKVGSQAGSPGIHKSFSASAKRWSLTGWSAKNRIDRPVLSRSNNSSLTMRFSDCH